MEDCNDILIYNIYEWMELGHILKSIMIRIAWNIIVKLIM